MIRMIAALAALVLLPAASLAQNVGGVFGPTVNENDKQLEFRLGLAPNQNDDWGAVARLHYQQAFNDSLRLRGVIQYADPVGGDLELKHFQLELLWQTVERTESGYESAFRFDARVSENDDGADRVGVNWIHQWSLDNGWRIRALGLFNTEVGPAARDGINVGFRSSATRRIDNGLRVGVENFSSFGNTDRGFGNFDDQRHSIGPVVTGSFSPDWGWYTGVQFGVSERANDHDWQFRVTRNFQVNRDLGCVGIDC